MIGRDEIETQASRWVTRRNGTDWSRYDEVELEAWLSSSIDHRVAYLRLKSIWDRADVLRETREVPVERAWLKRFAIPASIAASLTLLAGGGWMWSQRFSVVHVTGIGKHENVQLHDGSSLALNTDTRLVAVVDKGAREVWLDHGEAYFEIAHDPLHPFVIHAGKRVVTVLGTKFTVRQDGDHFRLAVTEGRVRLNPDASRSAHPLMLTRGDVATATGDDVLVKTEAPAALADDLAWRDGTVVFGRVTLAEAVNEMNRYSTRKLIISDPAIGSIRVGGQFSTDNVEGFTRLVQSSLGLTVTPSSDEIRISR